MIYVDAAMGSALLADQLEAAGLPIHRDEDGGLPHLDYADIEFAGRGVKGEQLMIGIEMKRLSELTSDFDRLAGHQIPKMNANYAHRFLIIEGEWLQNKRGSLLKRTGRASFRPLHGQCNATQLRKKLLTLEMCAGVHVACINHWGKGGGWSVETVRYVSSLYRWWTDDDFDEHKSHIVSYQPHGLIPLTKYAQAFGAWPGLSMKRGKAVAKAFKNSIRRAASASIEEWAAVETVDDDGHPRRLGTKLAEGIDRFLDGKD
jgi:hypothetical protein